MRQFMAATSESSKCLVFLDKMQTLCRNGRMHASHSVSVWDFFVERDKLRPLCSPDQSHEITKHARQDTRDGAPSPQLERSQLNNPVQIRNDAIRLGIELLSGALKAEIGEILSNKDCSMLFPIGGLSSNRHGADIPSEVPAQQRAPSVAQVSAGRLRSTCNRRIPRLEIDVFLEARRNWLELM
jgi:hypothetical protein